MCKIVVVNENDPQSDLLVYSPLIAAMVRCPVASGLIVGIVVVTMRGLTGETAAEREAAEIIAPVEVGLLEDLV